MKKILSLIIISISIISCNNGESAKASDDSPNASSPSISEDTSTLHPNGVTSDGVISTDTSAFGVKAGKPNRANKK